MKFQLSETIWWWIEPCGEAPFYEVSEYSSITQAMYAWMGSLTSFNIEYENYKYGARIFVFDPTKLNNCLNCS